MNTSSSSCTIPFKGLSLGKHTFSFVLGDNFFKQQDTELVEGGRLAAVVELNKLNNLLELMVRVEGELTVACDRCLDSLQLPIDADARLVVDFSGQPEESEENEDADRITLSYADAELDLGQYIFETAYLSLPIQKVHPDGEDGVSTCNKEMIEKLGQLLVR